MFQPARRLLLSISLAIAATVMMAPPPAQAQMPSFAALTSEPRYASIVVDAKTGEVLYAKKADSPRYPASITKVMTLYLTFEALAAGKLDLDDPVVFSPRAAAQPPTKLGVPSGQSITVEQAMQALAIKSANDVAVAMAETLAGTENRFAALMTLRARELGMHNTRFVNASGLPDSRQVSTARDLAILSRAVMRDYPQYYKLFSQDSFTFRGKKINSHNHLLGVPGVDGLKTGYIRASGFNIAISGVRDDRRLIVVVLGGPTSRIRDENAENLLLTGFDVMNRRAHGEQITIAQNLFEPEVTESGVELSMEQGDAEPDGEIVLASASASKRASQIEIAEPGNSGKWIVQVGAFKSRADAKEQLAIVEKRFGKIFKTADGLTDRGGGMYRARFSGFSQGAAKDACKALKARRMPCMVFAPG